MNISEIFICIKGGDYKIKSNELLDIISHDDLLLTVTVGDKEYCIKNSRLIHTSSNLDDKSLHRTLVCGEEIKGNIIR